MVGILRIVDNIDLHQFDVDFVFFCFLKRLTKRFKVLVPCKFQVSSF